jgi:Rad3-related DNA helicase
MPTGSGKTPIPIALALAAGWRVAILTSTKALQQQYLGDFGELLTDARGRNNFGCIHRHNPGFAIDSESSCEAGADSGCPDAHDEDSCPYANQFARAQAAQLVVTNYKYFMLAQQQKNNLGKFDLLVLDEAHEAPQEICEAAATGITWREVSQQLKTSRPAECETMSARAWSEWAAAQLPDNMRRLDRLEKLREDVKAGRVRDAWTPNDSRHLRRLRSAIAKLERLAAIGDNPRWAPVASREGIELQPLWATPHAEAMLYQYAKRVLLLSATLIEKTYEYLGIPSEDRIHNEYPCPFSPERWAIWFLPGQRVYYDMAYEQKRLLYSRIDAIIEPRQDRRTIITSGSYQRAEEIRLNSKFHNIIVGHDSRNTVAAVEYFMTAPPPIVLCSPAIDTGWNFAGPAARACIIPKHPTLDTRSVIESLRNNQDKDYKHYVAAIKLTQAVGRIVRSMNDWGEVFLLDTVSMDHLYNKPKMYPRFLRRYVRKTSGYIPGPMQFDPEAI